MKTVYTGCNLIDVEDGCRIIPDASVYVDGDKIVKTVSGKADTAGFTEVNLQGKYVAPGLVNLHAPARAIKFLINSCFRQLCNNSGRALPR